MIFSRAPQESTILIVDDQPSNIQVLAKLLKEEYRIQVAVTGEKALALSASEHPPDLILLDIEMPEMDGYEVCRLLKTNEKTKNIPIIFVTARDRAQDEEMGFHLGAVDYISKPFHPDIVRARVRNQTQRSWAEEALRQSSERYRRISNISSLFISLPPEEVNEGIHYALKTVGEFFQVDRCYIFQFFEDRKVMSNTYEWCAEDIQKQKEKFQHIQVDSFPWWSNRIMTDLQVYIPDVDAMPEEACVEKREFQSQKIKSLLNVPIIINGSIFGFIGMNSTKKNILCTEEHFLFFNVVAEFLSNAFARYQANKKITQYTKDLERQSLELEELNRLLDEEIDKARKVHENTLPKTRPHLDSFQLYDYNQPAYKMGGDFYDFIQIKKNVLLFYISDITGHGLDAAMMSAFVKNTISTYVELIPDIEHFHPQQLVDFMFRHYRKEHYPEDYFISILLGIIDVNELVLTYCSAGMHVHPVLFHKKEIIELPAGGLPISTAISTEDFFYNTHKVSIPRDSILFFSTDGLIEQNLGESIYGNRFQRIIESKRKLPLWVIGEEIHKDFFSVTGNPAGDDDITYILMKTMSLEDIPSQNLVIESRIEELERVKKEFRSFIEPYVHNQAGVLMTFHELVINAMEHGNSFQPHKKVKILTEVHDSYLLVSVEDEGPGYEWRKRSALVEKNIQEVTAKAAREGRGLGLWLVNTTTDYFYDCIHENRNRASFVILRQDTS